ncbi:MAG: FAD-dependent protein [Butyricicoccus pullicaecorum]
MREQIITWGGEVHFRTATTGIRQQGDVLCAIDEKSEHRLRARHSALGHSARDTFLRCTDKAYSLNRSRFRLVRVLSTAKAKLTALYGKHAGHPLFPPGEYNHHRENGRACYSFCMCPGGHVEGSERSGSIVTNGMSYHARDGKNAKA